jgi:hypothetical protein
MKPVVLLSGLGVLVGGAYLLRLNRLSKELIIESAVRVHKFGLEGITLAIGVGMKNPTGATLSVKHPMVSLFYQAEATPLTSSDPKDKDYRIPAYGTLQLDTIYLTVSALSAGMKAFDFLKAYMAQEPVSLTVRTVTTIIGGRVPYETVQQVQLTKGRDGSG